MGFLEPTTAPINPSAHWEGLALNLRDNPHAWWIVVPRAASRARAKDIAKKITHGRYPAFRPEGHYEASSTRDWEVKAIYHGPECRYARTQVRRDCTCQAPQPHAPP